MKDKEYKENMKEIKYKETKPPRYYINPLTGRMINSKGKVYANLMHKNRFVEKHMCLYNVKSAKNVLKNY